MTENMIGNNIAEMRKSKGITQEELAGVVGVSTQAVSKWECGGSPDIELLPAIADYFQVPIDKLFGRKITDFSNIETEMAKHIKSIPQEERIKAVFNHCWTLQKAISGNIDPALSIDAIEARKIKQQQYSQMLFDSGVTLMSLNNGIHYFFMMPEPEKGWGAKLGEADKFQKLFNLFGDPDVIKSLFVFYKRDNNKAFTPKLLVKEFGFTDERAVEILSLIKEYKLVRTEEIMLDDETQTVYHFSPNPAFLALLIAADELINKPNSFYYYSGGRTKPYLNADA